MTLEFTETKQQAEINLKSSTQFHIWLNWLPEKNKAQYIHTLNAASTSESNRDDQKLLKKNTQQVVHRKFTFGIMLLNSQGDLTGHQNCCLWFSKAGES